ncbi:MAG: acyl-ACP--UDP-N-acetylglucosamine O-acyltransferase [Rhodobacteraceae bacterium]|nr:acyl-ACP--UDP-N-acetylglucosamine O-acyltransferase [Paracoccaceae bacterium]
MRIASSAKIHPSAIVEEGAEIGAGCTVGAFAVIGPSVRLGERVVIRNHAVITGHTDIGDDTAVFPFAVIGEIPQDLKFKGEESRLIIGKRNRIREHVTINTGTEGGGLITRVGDDCLIMAGAHVGHDCQIGNKVILVNSAALAGHCVIEDEAIVGGLSGVHQFVRIGRGAMIGAVTMVTADVIPYGMVHGPRGTLDGLNIVGLKRRGAARADISALRDLMDTLGQGTFRETAREQAEAGTESPMAREVLDFILGPSDRSFLTPR